MDLTVAEGVVYKVTSFTPNEYDNVEPSNPCKKTDAMRDNKESRRTGCALSLHVSELAKAG